MEVRVSEIPYRSSPLWSSKPQLLVLWTETASSLEARLYLPQGASLAFPYTHPSAPRGGLGSHAPATCSHPFPGADGGQDAAVGWASKGPFPDRSKHL
jgi:hypothetical protein